MVEQKCKNCETFPLECFAVQEHNVIQILNRNDYLSHLMEGLMEHLAMYVIIDSDRHNGFKLSFQCVRA